MAYYLYALFNWNYFFYLYDRQTEGIEERCQKLNKRILKLSAKNEVIILSRSSGGRVSSLIADNLDVKHIICIGYPFQNPDNGIETERFQHLAYLKTPMLIIQGVNDEYGGIEVKEKYKLSPSVKLFFVDTDHNFNIDDETWNKVYQKIEDVIR